MLPRCFPAFSRTAFVAGLFLLAACGGSSTTPETVEPTVILPPPSSTTPVADWGLPAQAYDDRSFYATNPGYTEDQYAQIAAMPMAMYQLRWCLSDEGSAVIAELRRRNPDIVIIGVHNVLSVPLEWGEATNRERFPMSAAIYDILADHTLTSSEGETVWMWSGSPMINPMRGSGIDQSLMNRTLNVISEWATIYPGAVDGIMHDYTSERPWAWPEGDASVAGFIDLDKDGVPFADDLQEQAAWKEWQHELARQLQDRFGEGFIQIANGRLPIDDQVMAQLVAGVIFQKFPRTVWNVASQVGLDWAIRMREPGWLVPRRGQYWNFYWAATSSEDGQTDFRRYASYLTGDLYEVNTTTASNFVGADPDRVELGAALGPMTRTKIGDTDRYERTFEGGTVQIDFNSLGNVTAQGVSPPGGTQPR